MRWGNENKLTKKDEGGWFACVWHLGVPPFFQSLLVKGERENSALKREGGAETEPLTPLGEKGFIAGVESSGLPHEFPLSGLISGHCWDVTKEEYVDGRWRGKGRSEVEGREARGGCCKGGKGQEYGAVKQIWSKGSRRATVSTSFCSRALQSNHHLSVSVHILV